MHVQGSDRGLVLYPTTVGGATEQEIALYSNPHEKSILMYILFFIIIESLRHSHSLMYLNSLLYVLAAFFYHSFDICPLLILITTGF